MLTTAWVAEIAWNLGALRPSGGAGPVLHRVQLLGAFPAEFTAQTSKEKSVRHIKSKVTSSCKEAGNRATEHNRMRGTVILELQNHKGGQVYPGTSESQRRAGLPSF